MRRAAGNAFTDLTMSEMIDGDLCQDRSNDSNQYNGSQSDTETTWRFVISSGDASLTFNAERESSIDFLSILGIAQKLDIDFLPITWQPALDTAGDGATAEIRQSLINVQTSFAFKRYKRRWEPRSDADYSGFQRLYFEISILGQPEIRRHPNIIRLEGLCWDISPDSKEIWPVLVFEKTSFGDLTKWSASKEGRAASHDVRLSICADVASAVRHLHTERRYLAIQIRCILSNESADIIHGDIKPDNVLIFKDEANRFVARVADFGFSTIFKSQSTILVPKSGHWTAPEWHHRGFKASSAIKMDVYSLGVLSLWLTFYDKSHHKRQPFPEYLTSNICSPPELKKTIFGTPGISEKVKIDLAKFFDGTLALDPDHRTSDLTECISLLTQKL